MSPRSIAFHFNLFFGFFSSDYINRNVRNIALDEVYSMNEFTQFDPFHKPTLSLIDKHLQTVVDCLKKHKDVISPTPDDQIGVLIEASEVPSTQEGDRMVMLQLHPSPNEMLPDGTQAHLFTRAKKQVVELLLAEVPGKDVKELVGNGEYLSCGISEHRLKQTSSPNCLFTASSDPALHSQQLALQTDLSQLESDGRTTSSDSFQSIVTDIANDIRLHERRQRERAEQKRSIAQTKRKLIEQREELKEKLSRYEEYLETCLQNLSRTSRRLSFRPNTKEAGKIQKERASLDQIKSYKSSAEKLFKKGVIVDVAAYQTPKRLAKLSVEVASTEERGVFGVSLIEGGKVVEAMTLHFPVSWGILSHLV